MGKHTPGPWAVDAERGEIFADDGDVRPLIATVNFEGTSEEQASADARLIAAAPDLLAAAEAFCAPYVEVTDKQLEYCAKGQGDGVSINITAETATALLTFRAALAKAGA